ncbi:DUF3307 domain-containing protein [Negadavirga shengliensis]|uniref:DUF3307 domain-containing protein n=1 Tax=Negadavirga shengliensis TaxID=1389218 RepID=A0ABV9T666_9BACT
MILFIKLLLAHFIGDFFLQPGSWVEVKEKRKIKAYQLYIHALLHGMLVMLLVWDIQYWPWALFLAVSHWCIDVVKLYSQNENTKRLWFFLDQFAHVVIILLLVHFSGVDVLVYWKSWGEAEWLTFTAIVFLTIPASIVIKTIISKWDPLPHDDGTSSLQEAGKYIGILERLFVFVFIVSGRWEAIGFLVAAKSVFRFGDLRQSKDRKLTEYILIGTLLSFGLAILTGMVFLAWR